MTSSALDDDVDAHFAHSSKLYWNFRFSQDSGSKEIVNHRLRAELRMILHWDPTSNDSIDERFSKQGPFMANMHETIAQLIASKSSAAPKHVLLRFAHALCPLIAHNEGLQELLRSVDAWICEITSDSASDKENTTTPRSRKKSLEDTIVIGDESIVQENDDATPTVRRSMRKPRASTVKNEVKTPVRKRSSAAPVVSTARRRRTMETPAATSVQSSSSAESSTSADDVPDDEPETVSSSNDDTVGSQAPSGAQDPPVKAPDSVLPQRDIFAYADRMPLTKGGRDKECFVCKGKKEGKLLNCEGDRGRNCGTRFHEECILAYNAGEYSYEFMKAHIGSLCPLHHCSVCMIERRKTSAIFGNLVTCQKCFRAFHDICLPATVVVETQTIALPTKKDGVVQFDVATTICHAHAEPFKGKEKFPVLTGAQGKKLHLPFCCECESDVDHNDLIACTKCIRSFHARCHQFTTIHEGDELQEAKVLCEGCIYQEVPRAGQNAISRYGNSFYPCVTVALSKYPAHCAEKDKYGKYLGQPGFVAVEWSGCQNLFSLLPVGMVVPMFNGSFYLIGKRMKDPDLMLAWKEMDENCEPLRMPVPLNDNYIHIDKSVLVGSCRTSTKYKEIDVDHFNCSCDAKNGPRCDVDSACTNRDFDQECPPECKEKGRECHNRIISDHLVHPEIERRVAEGKGYGVFAKAKIPAAVLLAEYAGEIIDLDEKQRRVEQTAKWRNNEETHYMMTLDPTRIIDCKRKGNIARFINHSCDPNCKMQVVDIVVSTESKNKKRDSYYKIDRRVGVRTIREIKPDEELTFNYQMDQYAPGIEVPNCQCGSEKCTGKLAAKNTKQKKEQQPKDAPQQPQAPAAKAIKAIPAAKKTPAAKMTAVKRRASMSVLRQSSSSTSTSAATSSSSSSSVSMSIAQSVKRARRSATVNPASAKKLRRSPRTSAADASMPQLEAEDVDVGKDTDDDVRMKTGRDATSKDESPEAENISPPPSLLPVDQPEEDQVNVSVDNIAASASSTEAEEDITFDLS